MSTMKALYTTGPGKYGLSELPIPEPGSGEVRIRVLKAGLCPNEIRLREGLLPISYPVVPGHQFAGVVDSCGPEIRYLNSGDRVSVHSYILCGNCQSCRSGGVHDCDNFNILGFSLNGGFAEYCVVPEKYLFNLPSHVTLEEGELMENTANAVAAVRNAAIMPGESIVVIGTSPIGLLSLQVASLWSPSKLVLIGSGVNYIQNIGGFGAGHLIDINDRSVIERTNGIFKGKGADAVIVCASDKGALEMAIDLVASQGRIVVEGHYDPSVEITFSPFNLLVARSVVMRANRGWLTPDYVRALKLISDGMLDAKSLITHRFSLEQWEEAFETFSTKRGNAIQVAIEP